LAAERDRVLADARNQARRIVEDAHGQTGVRLDDQAVVQAARQRARDITLEAEKTAAQLRAEADQYILNQFTMMEARLMRVLREVQAGQRALTRGQGGDEGERKGPGGGQGAGTSG
jgi:vacuolar-type H+-ATPase subunit H